MARQELEQVRQIKEEIRDTVKRIHQLGELGQPVADSVQASSAQFPYLKHTVKVCGVPFDSQKQTQHREELLQLRGYLEKRHGMLVQEEMRFHQLVDSYLTDYTDRRILKLYYLEGMTFLRISFQVHLSESGVKHRFYRALQTLEGRTKMNGVQ